MISHWFFCDQLVYWSTELILFCTELQWNDVNFYKNTNELHMNEMQLFKPREVSVLWTSDGVSGENFHLYPETNATTPRNYKTWMIITDSPLLTPAEPVLFQWWKWESASWVLYFCSSGVWSVCSLNQKLWICLYTEIRFLKSGRSATQKPVGPPVPSERSCGHMPVKSSVSGCLTPLNTWLMTVIAVCHW